MQLIQPEAINIKTPYSAWFCTFLHFELKFEHFLLTSEFKMSLVVRKSLYNLLTVLQLVFSLTSVCILNYDWSLSSLHPLSTAKG